MKDEQKVYIHKYTSNQISGLWFALLSVLALLLCSCGDGTRHVVVTPLYLGEYSANYTAMPKQVWRVTDEELGMVSEGDTIQFKTVWNNVADSNLCVIQKIETEN